MSIIIETFTNTTVWKAPTGLEHITIECWGGGGGGTAGSGDFISDNFEGDGGGGGAYASSRELPKTVFVPGKEYDIIVGSGGVNGLSGTTSMFRVKDNLTPYCIATPGSGGYINRAGAIGTLGMIDTCNGGNGATSTIAGPGGGGSSGAYLVNGSNGSNPDGGVAPSGGGSGGSGNSAGVGNNGEFPGGGGGGGGNGFAGGNGAKGFVKLTYRTLDYNRGTEKKHEGLSLISLKNPVSFDDY